MLSEALFQLQKLYLSVFSRIQFFKFDSASSNLFFVLAKQFIYFEAIEEN